MKSRVIFDSTLTKKQQQARDEAIKKQILELDRQYTIDCYAAILWTLHVHEGWGKKKLRQIHDAMREEHKRMDQHYQMPNEYIWLCKHFLKEMGVDVEAWNEEPL